MLAGATLWDGLCALPKLPLPPTSSLTVWRDDKRPGRKGGQGGSWGRQSPPTPPHHNRHTRALHTSQSAGAAPRDRERTNRVTAERDFSTDRPDAICGLGLDPDSSQSEVTDAYGTIREICTLTRYLISRKQQKLGQKRFF